MSVPTPQRKSASVDLKPNGAVPATNEAPMPAKRSAEPFGSVDKSVYTRKSVGITPQGVPINDKDAGSGTGNDRGGARQKMSYPLKGGE